jgi:pimeloyl-ACP methyl ester carboxylesterase
LRHAESIYGLPLNVASAPGTSLTQISDHNIVICRTGIRSEDLLCTQFQSEAFLPAHYVAVDRQIRAIVVCIRGTANLLDSLTDLAATHDPFSIFTKSEPPRASPPEHGCSASIFTPGLIRGHGHAGVLRSARNLFEKLRSTLLAAVEQHKTYDVLLVGHSLGAAVAAVMSLIMRDDENCPRTRAIAIGPPPCVSLDIANEADETVVSVVNSSDIVPRLSVHNMMPYFTTCRHVAEMSAAKKAMVDMGLLGVAVDWDSLMKKASQEQKELEEARETSRLYIPGIVLQMVYPTEVRKLDARLLFLREDTKVDVLRVPRTDFVRVRRERRMLLNQCVIVVGHQTSDFHARSNLH